MFSIAAAPFYVPPAVYKSPSFSTSSAKLFIFCFFFYYSHTNGCELVSHCGFDRFLNENRTEDV